MRHPLLQLFVLVISTLLCGALLSYPAYKFTGIFTTAPFHKILSQVTTLCWLLFVFLFLRYNSVLSAKTIGITKNRIPVTREILTGWVMGMLIMFILASALILLGTHIPEPDLEPGLKYILEILIKAVLAGISVGVIEEILYRGALLGGLSGMMRTPAAVIVSSGIYAAAHFVKFRAVPAGQDINWVTGIQILPDAFFRFSDPAILDAFLTLFVFGILLALVRLKKGNIFQCIGIHTGVVMAIKLINELTDYSPGNNYEFLVNKYDHLMGYLAIAWLIVIILSYHRHNLYKLIRKP